jgi:NAD(P)-dependent dehydrogenase (short-subunit alcohol dehydrogenase family)
MAWLLPQQARLIHKKKISPRSMKKQTIIVTGASSGIGFGIAKYFLQRGDNVVINSIDASKLQEACLALGAGENVAPVAGDVSNKATGAALADKAIRQFGSIDVLVNNAGLFERKPFLEVDERYLDRFLRVNLKGTFFTSQAVIPQMIKQNDGVIINIGTPMVTKSIAGVDVTAAVSSKGAIHALTIQLAGEFGRYNIRTNVVAPGVIRTSLHVSDGKDTADQNAGDNLLDRVGEVEDIAQMVYTVAKSKFINGAIIDVDGGLGAGVSFSTKSAAPQSAPAQSAAPQPATPQPASPRPAELQPH